MKSYNQSFAEYFKEIADLLAITGGGAFQVLAYQKAAQMLGEEAEPITKRNASVEAFKKLPKIGDALAMKMMQLIETGKMEYLEKLRKEVPKGVRELLKIPGLGPKRIGLLYLNAGIKSKKELIAKAKTGELENLPGLGKKSVEKILEAIGRHQEKKKRHDRKEVEPFVQKILLSLKKIKNLSHAQAAGSYRRQASTVGDIDILVVGSSIDLIEEKALSLFPDHTLLGSGETKLSFMIFPQNLQVDIRSVPEESYGAALLYFTGSKEFNVKMRGVAIKKGYLLNEYGLMRQGEYVAGQNEEDVFDALGMDYVEPHKRR